MRLAETSIEKEFLECPAPKIFSTSYRRASSAPHSCFREVCASPPSATGENHPQKSVDPTFMITCAAAPVKLTTTTTTTRKRLTPQVLTSSSPSLPQHSPPTHQRTFHHLQHLLFNKLRLPLLERKRHQLESRFWAPSHDDVSRAPMEVYSGPWSQPHLDDDRVPPPVVTDDDPAASTPLWTQQLQSLSRLIPDDASSSAALKRRLQNLRRRWDVACELTDSVNHILADCLTTEASLQQVWKTVSHSTVLQHHRLSETVLKQRLSDLERERALAFSENRSTPYEFRTTRLRSLEKLYQTLRSSNSYEILHSGHPIQCSSNRILPGVPPSLLLITPRGSDCWATYWDAFDTATLQPAHLACYSSVQDSSITRTELLSWLRRFGALVLEGSEALQKRADEGSEPVKGPHTVLGGFIDAPAVNDLATLETNEEVLVHLASRYWQQRLPLALPSFSPEGSSTTMIHAPTSIFLPKTPRINPVHHGKRRLTQPQSSLQTASHRQTPFYVLSPALPPGMIALSSIVTESGPFTFHTSRMYFWKCCTLVVDWEQRNPTVKALLPLLASELLVDGPHILLRTGLAVALQRLATELPKDSASPWLNKQPISFSPTLADPTAAEPTSCREAFPPPSSKYAQCPCDSSTEAHQNCNSVIASWIHSTTDCKMTLPTAFPCPLFLVLPPWLVQLWCSVMEGASENATSWGHLRSVIHGYLLLRLYGVMRGRDDTLKTSTAPEKPSSSCLSRPTPLDAPPCTAQEELENPLFALLQKQKMVSVSSYHELFAQRSLFPSAATLLQDYPLLSSFDVVRDCYPGASTAAH